MLIWLLSLKVFERTYILLLQNVESFLVNGELKEMIQ